jgi:hypothetical protein
MLFEPGQTSTARAVDEVGKKAARRAAIPGAGSYRLRK